MNYQDRLRNFRKKSLYDRDQSFLSLKLNILIGAVTFVLCLIISIVNGMNFLWLFIPIVFIILAMYLSSLLNQRFGSTYGITAYLIVLFIIPLIWFMFSSNMPITSVMIESQKNAEDLSAFEDYAGSVDAKKEIARYQIRQDSLIREQVAALLRQNLVDSALAVIKQHDINSERIKKELLSKVTLESSNSSFGKRAIIRSPDGYAFIRNSPGAVTNPLGKIWHGETFYAQSDNTSEWWKIKTQQGIIGYLHKDELVFIGEPGGQN